MHFDLKTVLTKTHISNDLSFYLLKHVSNRLNFIVSPKLFRQTLSLTILSPCNGTVSHLAPSQTLSTRVKAEKIQINSPFYLFFLYVVKSPLDLFNLITVLSMFLVHL